MKNCANCGNMDCLANTKELCLDADTLEWNWSFWEELPSKTEKVPK